MLPPDLDGWALMAAGSATAGCRHSRSRFRCWRPAHPAQWEEPPTATPAAANCPIVDAAMGFLHPVRHSVGGARSGGPRMRCAECGQETAGSSQYCAACGAPITRQRSAVAEPAAPAVGGAVTAGPQAPPTDPQAPQDALPGQRSGRGKLLWMAVTSAGLVALLGVVLLIRGASTSTPSSTHS